MDSNASKLTAKQEQFCQEYLIDLNATQSAIRAGYSAETAGQIGSENLKKLEIQDRISELKTARQLRTLITQDRVLLEYAKIAFFDIREVYDVDGGLMNVKQIDNNSVGAIASIKSLEETCDGVVIGVNKEVKVFDKIRALDAISKHIGLFEKDNRQKDQVKQSIVINGKEIEF